MTSCWNQPIENQDKYEYVIVLSIGAGDLRMFSGSQEPQNVNPTPVTIFRTDRDMFAQLTEAGWMLRTSTLYPYDKHLRFIWERVIPCPDPTKIKI